MNDKIEIKEAVNHFITLFTITFSAGAGAWLTGLGLSMYWRKFPLSPDMLLTGTACWLIFIGTLVRVILNKRTH